MFCSEREISVVRVIDIIVYYMISLLYRVFTIGYLQRNMFLPSIMFNLFCSYNSWRISDVGRFVF